MTESVGAIYFTVEAETGKLINGLDSATRGLDSLDASFNKTGKASGQAEMKMTRTATAVRGLGKDAEGASSSLGGLGKVLGGLLTLQGANNLIQMAESYNTMAERVQMATSSQIEYELVQQRLLTTANKTYRALSEAQEIYIQTADGLRSMGYSTSEALDITDSLSYSFVKNSTAADRAQSALRTYDLALNKGKVDAMGWLTVVGAIPSVVADIATAAGKTEAEIRRMGASGEITARMLNEGLRQSLESNKKAADGMATTVSDALIAMRNNLSAYVGEANQASGATSVMSAAIVGLSENIDVIVKTLAAAGAGAMALYVSRAGASAIASGQAAVAALRSAQAKAAEASASAAAAGASGVHAVAATTEAAAVNSGAAAAANKTRSLLTMVGAQRAATVAGTALLGAMGGIPGLIALIGSAAAGWYLFSDSADKARGALVEMERPLDDVVEKFKQLNEAQRSGALVRYAEAQAQAAEDASVAFNELFASISGVNSFRTDWSIGQWAAFREEIVAARKAGEDLTLIIQRAASESGVHPSVIDSWLKLNEAVANADQSASRASNVLETLRNLQENLASAIRDTTAAQHAQNSTFNDAASTDYLKRLKDQTNALRDGNSEVKRAQRYIAEQKEAGNVFSPERQEEILNEAVAHDKLIAARTKAASANRATKKTGDEATKGAQENAKAIAAMGEAVYLAGLKGQALAAAKAKSALNKFATPDEIAQVEALAQALWGIDEAERRRGKFGSTAADADLYIMGNLQPLSGGAFDDQYARYEAEAEAEQKRYDDQLERLRQARDLQIETIKSYDEMEEQAARDHANRLQQIEQAKAQVLLSSGENLFGALADAAKNYAGESSGAYKAMFAASKAFAIANATLSLSSAIAQVMNNPAEVTPAQKFASMAAVASAGGQLVSAISSASYGGGRQYGGPVAAGKMYRINETGAPEILNTNGKQYLMMNQSSGRVTPMESGGAGGHGGAVGGGQPIQINIEVNVSGDGGSQTQASGAGPQQAQQFAGLIAGQVRQVVIEELGQGGLLWNQRHGYS